MTIASSICVPGACAPHLNFFVTDSTGHVQNTDVTSILNGITRSGTAAESPYAFLSTVNVTDSGATSCPNCIQNGYIF